MFKNRIWFYTANMKFTIPSMFEHACTHYPDKPYLSEKTDQGWKSMSFAESRLKIRELASAWIARGITGPVAILAEGRPSWVVCENATFLTRSFSVPLSIKLSAEEISFRLAHAKVRCMVCSRLSHEKVIAARNRIDQEITILYLDSASDEAFKKLCDHFPKVLQYDDLVLEGRKILELPAHMDEIVRRENDVGEEDVATVSYTSGTTGNPKGIMLTQANYYHNCRQSLDGFPIPFDWKMFVILPIDHAFAHTIALYAALIQQFSLYFVDARGGAMGILRNIPLNMKEVKPDILLTVPSLSSNFMQKIQSSIREKGALIEGIFQAGLKARIYMNGNVLRRPPWYKRILPFFPAALAELLIFPKVREVFGGSMKLSIGGGAHLDVKQQEFFKAIGIPVYQGYGLTEAAPVISTNNRFKHKIGTSGPILPGIECRIIDEKGQVLPPDTKGQISMRGKNVMKGYLYNDEATKAALVDGWLLTGDIGKMDSDGFLHVIGREKALLISSDGEKYSPEEIEDAIISSSSFIAQCMLWCDHKNYTSALITLRADELKRKLQTLGFDTKGNDPGMISKALSLVIEDFNSYCKDPAYKDLFPSQWKPASFMIVPKQFTEAEGMINSTMKMVRSGVMKVHENLVMAQYTNECAKPNNEQNKALLAEALKD